MDFDTAGFSGTDTLDQPVPVAPIPLLDPVRAAIVRRNAARRGTVDASVALSVRRLVEQGMRDSRAWAGASIDLLVRLSESIEPERVEVDFLVEDRGEHLVRACDERARAIALAGLAGAGL